MAKPRAMRLVHEDTGREVREGDVVTSRSGETARVLSWTEPHSPYSSGRVYVEWISERGEARWAQEYYPTVFDLEFKPFLFAINPDEEQRDNPTVIGDELIYRVVLRDGSAYIEGLPSENFDGSIDPDTFLLYSYPDGDCDKPYDTKTMLGALYDEWQTNENLEQAAKPYKMVVFVTPFGRFMADTDDVQVVEDTRTMHGGRPRKNPGRSPGRTPPGMSQAVKTFEGFNAYPAKGASKFDKEIVIPQRMSVPGPCRWVTYKSDKWNDGTHDYIHTISSYPSVKCAMVGEEGKSTIIPAKIRNATTLTQIGLKALGFAFERDGEEFEAKLPRGTEWFWSQSGRALYLIHSKRTLVAVIWGGKLNVEPRGIVG